MWETLAKKILQAVIPIFLISLLFSYLAKSMFPLVQLESLIYTIMIISIFLFYVVFYVKILYENINMAKNKIISYAIFW